MDVLSTQADWNVILHLVNPDGSNMNLSGADIDVAFGYETKARKYLDTVSTGSGVTITDASGGMLRAVLRRAERTAILKLAAPNNVVVDVFTLTGRGTLNETRDFIGRAVFALSEGVEGWL